MIAGGHSKIALILERLLVQRGDWVAGLVRNPAHAADLAEARADALATWAADGLLTELDRRIDWSKAHRHLVE